jgi:hypothetical protein
MGRGAIRSLRLQHSSNMVTSNSNSTSSSRLSGSHSSSKPPSLILGALPHSRIRSIHLARLLSSRHSSVHRLWHLLLVLLLLQARISPRGLRNRMDRPMAKQAHKSLVLLRRLLLAVISRTSTISSPIAPGLLASRNPRRPCSRCTLVLLPRTFLPMHPLLDLITISALSLPPAFRLATLR